MSKEIKEKLIKNLKELRSLQFDSKYLKHCEKIGSLEDTIKMLKNNCKHEDIKLLRMGTEFDGYDRNEWYAEVYCPDCGFREKEYRKWTEYNGVKITDLPKLKL